MCTYGPETTPQFEHVFQGLCKKIKLVAGSHCHSEKNILFYSILNYSIYLVYNYIQYPHYVSGLILGFVVRKINL